MTSVPKVNQFAQVFKGQDIKPIEQAPAVTRKPTEEPAAKPTELASASNTVGVNTKIPVGALSYIPASVGHEAGTGRTLGFG